MKKTENKIPAEFWETAEGKPALRENTYAYVTYAYDNHNNCTEQCWYTAPGGDLATFPDGYNRIVNTYNNANRLARTVFYDGKTIATREDGYAVVAYDYDSRGRLTGRTTL